MPGKGISGTAVAVAAAGGFLLYIGIKNAPVLTGLRDIASGRLPTGTPSSHTSQSQSLQTALQAGYTTYAGSGNLAGPNAALGQAALKYVGLPYSQAPSLRLGPTAFDCSGLVWRCFKDIGVTAPTVTFTQQPWNQLVTIPRSQVQAGDLVFWPGHVVIAISNTEAVGAENPRRGVVRGLIDQLGVPGTPETCKRYVGPSSPSSTGKVLNA